jgi:hypothetical protein
MHVEAIRAPIDGVPQKSGSDFLLSKLINSRELSPSPFPPRKNGADAKLFRVRSTGA